MRITVGHSLLFLSIIVLVCFAAPGQNGLNTFPKSTGSLRGVPLSSYSNIDRPSHGIWSNPRCLDRFEAGKSDELLGMHERTLKQIRGEHRRDWPWRPLDMYRSHPVQRLQPGSTLVKSFSTNSSRSLLMGEPEARLYVFRGVYILNVDTGEDELRLIRNDYTGELRLQQSRSNLIEVELDLSLESEGFTQRHDLELQFEIFQVLQFKYRDCLWLINSSYSEFNHSDHGDRAFMSFTWSIQIYCALFAEYSAPIVEEASVARSKPRTLKLEELMNSDEFRRFAVNDAMRGKLLLTVWIDHDGFIHIMDATAGAKISKSHSHLLPLHADHQGRRILDLPITEAVAEGAAESKPRTKLKASIVVLAGLASFFLLYTLHTRHYYSPRDASAKNHEVDMLEQFIPGPQRFKLKELKAATQGFSSSLGAGGSGSVFRGKLMLPGHHSRHERDVAVKRIFEKIQVRSDRVFLAERDITGQVHHRNIMPLLGWCHESGERLLVYDYMLEGSLDQHLFADGKNRGPLPWAQRWNVANAVAKALHYMHHDCGHRLVHGDVKAANVMLDANFNAFLGDFGLARSSDHNNGPPSTLFLGGTLGYIAPELQETSKFTEKTDVYSFGALVLELATGKRALLPPEDRRTPDEVLLVWWVRTVRNHGSQKLLLATVADRRLGNEHNRTQMMILLTIGLWCSEHDPSNRPTMGKVLNILEGTTPCPPLPPRPRKPWFKFR